MPPTAPPRSSTTTEFKHTVEHSTRKLDWADYITLATPILTFILGYFLNALVESLKEKKRLNDVERHFHSQLSILSEALGQQITALQGVATKFDLLQTSTARIPTLPSLKTSRIRAIPDSDLYKAFIIKRKFPDNDRPLSRVTIATDNIDAIIANIIKINENIETKMLEFGKDWNARNEELFEINARVVMEAQATNQEPDADTDSILRAITRHLRLLKEANNGQIVSSPQVTYDSFIKPLYDDVHEIKPKAANYSLLSLIINQNGEYKRLVLFKNSVAAKVSELATMLQTTQTRINNANTALRRPKKTWASIAKSIFSTFD